MKYASNVHINESQVTTVHGLCNVLEHLISMWHIISMMWHVCVNK